MHPALLGAFTRLDLVDRWMTPFFRLSSGLPREKIFRAFLEPFAGKPTTVQLMGVDAALLAEGAACFAALGAQEINLNFGCPSRQVCSGGAGGGALRNAPHLTKILQTIRRSVRIPVSAKFRAGYASETELPRLAEALLEGGAEKLYFHYRTVAELYAPAPRRMERFGRMMAYANNVPVVLNGDIDTEEDARKLLAAFNPAGLMAARGLLRDPGLLRRLAGCETTDAETLRHALYRAASPGTLRPGQRTELTRLLWGTLHAPEENNAIREGKNF